MGSLRKSHIDLFSGIGGFALASKWAGFKTIQFVENDKYCCKVLKKNFPEIPIHDDIKTFKATDFRGCGLITGGFPCQPVSQAGQRRGSEDDRWLWPQMYRVILESRPTYVLIENVAGLITLGLDDVLVDLEKADYSFQTFNIPAVAVDARHRRQRIWILAYSDSGLSERENQEIFTRRDSVDNGSKNVAYTDSKREIGNKSEYREGCGFESRSEDVADTECNSQRTTHRSDSGIGGRGWNEQSISEGDQVWCNSGDSSENVAHSNSKRGCSRETNREDAEDVRESSRCEKHGYWVTEPDVGRVAHGVPNRVDRLKGLGNSIVPAVAYEIIRCLK